jgi:FHA domain
MEAVLQGPFGRTVLGSRVLTIGRALDNQLVVNNPTASSHHAEIRPGVYGYSLTDLGSFNGTFVNEQKLDRHIPHLLQGGDRIRIGDMTFMYEVDSPDLRGPLVQESTLEDAPTGKLRASEYRAHGQSERFGYQPPAPYSSYTPQQQPAPPSFTPAFQQSNTPPWATDRATSYTMPEEQPYMPSSVKPKSSNRLKVLLIVLSIVLVLGAGGGGIAAYLLTRPQPVMSVTSNYNVGSIPAGSTGTVLHVKAHSFSGSSAITFLLDNLPVASNQNVSSDADGNVRADLTVTNAWTLGNHTLTAKDASGYATKAGVTVAIVPQGQAHTPGPNRAPPDDMSFTLNASVHFQDAGTGKQLGSDTETLIVTGKPDPSGGTVCRSYDDGQPYTYTGNAGNGITYRETYVLSCSGTYKGGNLSYTETATSDKVNFSDGVSCVAHTPYVSEHLEGTFTSQNTISGTLSSDSITADCNRGIGTQQSNARKGSWTAQM